MKRSKGLSRIDFIAREILQKCFAPRPKRRAEWRSHLEQLDPRLLLSVPPAPLDLISVTHGSGEIDLSWDASTTATGYDVYRGTDAGGESQTPLNEAPLTANVFQDVTVDNGSHYYYTIKAVNDDGSSDASVEADGWTTPAAPIDLWGTNYGINLLVNAQQLSPGTIVLLDYDKLVVRPTDDISLDLAGSARHRGKINVLLADQSVTSVWYGSIDPKISPASWLP